MHIHSRNVLPLFDPPRQKSYRAAVAQIIRELKAREGLTNVALGEELGCSGETIGNAENEHTDLNAVTLLRIAYVYGEKAIDPVRELYLRRHEPEQTLDDRFAAITDELNACANRWRHEQSDRLRSRSACAIPLRGMW